MPDVWGADWWDAWQAFGTVGAVTIAIFLALFEGLRARRAEAALASERKQRKQSDRISTASLVSAWIETTHEPSADGTHYLRRGTLHLANESNEPVFNVQVLVGIGRPVVQIGPLAVPHSIPVLPSRHHRSWDISLGLLGFGGGLQLPSDPVAKLAFTDVNEVRWNRDFDGKLGEQSAEGNEPKPDDTEGMRQLGDPTNTFNPIWAALDFHNLIRREEPPITRAELSPLLAEKAHGWDVLDDVMIQSMGKDLDDYGMAAHAWFPAPQVAYIRLVREEETTNPSQGAEAIEIQAQIITLVFYAGIGWKIFSVGGGVTEPNWIEFPPGTISDDPWTGAFLET
ncbi:hypothetical protein KRR55_19480 [Paeniglutamicibacter sp. ABSL32-1]|uniref:hypothetical protein n=1 Tax=Paeniglutamicibacter quisquiliarum TaxID=2849498 RepID=UPI001C2D0F1C|nr:hypothetical protein [Paeniglutamicibacter quisquiliarum]MBV1781296.1 hypothetical protein [Paeniglutamicibacter quisquiliarum]